MSLPAFQVAVPFTLLSALGAVLFGTVAGCGDVLTSEADSVTAAENLRRRDTRGQRQPHPGSASPEAGASTGGSEASVTAGFRAIAPCNSEADYVTAAVVTFRVGEPRYSPPCLRLASGGTVVFLGSLLEQPLEPRDSDTTSSTSNPIKPTFDGGSVEFEFPDQGFFPYRSAADPTMVGVIWASTQ